MILQWVLSWIFRTRNLCQMTALLFQKKKNMTSMVAKFWTNWCVPVYEILIVVSVLVRLAFCILEPTVHGAYHKLGSIGAILFPHIWISQTLLSWSPQTVWILMVRSTLTKRLSSGLNNRPFSSAWGLNFVLIWWSDERFPACLSFPGCFLTSSRTVISSLLDSS